MSRKIDYISSDDPTMERPGLIDKERDFWDHGRHMAFEPNSAEDMAKGNIGSPAKLVQANVPWKNLRGRK